MKKLLYLSDLYDFYVSQNKNVKFSSKDNNTTIVVHIDEPFIYSETEDNDLIMECPLRLCHTLTNKNKSHIPEKAMNEAIPSAYNMPILGYIYKNEDDDEYYFAGHEFFVNNDGDVEYEESPCGTVPESAGLKLVKYDGDDRSYLEGKGIVWRTYTRAADIIEREKELSVSVELVVDELSFDSKNKELVIDKFRFSGVTILGRDRNTGDEIQPGMENSKISITDFSETNNSVFSQNEMVIEMLSALNEKIDNLNINQNTSKKGGTEALKKEFDEQAEEEIKGTPSTENFDGDENGEGVDYYEEPQAEENEAEEPEVKEESTEEPKVEEPAPKTEGDDDQEDGEDNELTIPLGQRDDDDDTAGSKKYSVELTINTDNEKKTFSTLIEKLDALSELVNATYGEVDNDWYAVDADEEKKVVEMHQWFGGKHYRQSYSVKKDVYSLVGDRVETYAKYLTEDEIKSLCILK